MSFTKPRFTTSCASLFEERGNPWLSGKDKAKDFPLSQSRMADEPLSEHEARTKAIRDSLEEALGRVAQDFAPPQPSFHISPDMDQFTKATRARAKSIFKDPEGKPIEACYARRIANINLKMRRELNKRKTVIVK
jgi:hypothetical protein